MADKLKVIEVPFGAQDSELQEWKYNIPEGYTAEVKDGVVIIRKSESEDERIRKALIDALKVSETIGELKFRLPYPTREECIAYLEKQKDQKPTEWSEEDKDYYDTIVRKLEVIGDDCGLSNNQIKFLREHCPSHRSEWSEEDEKMIERLITRLTPNITFIDEIAWLKSLRPSWKPSEEQMNELHDVLNPGNWFDLSILATLYEDLKKLMEDEK